MREVRTFSDVEIAIEARMADEGGTPSVTLQAIKPGIVDDYGSVWKAGAFDASLEERLPVLCWGHDWSNPLGPGVEATPSRSGPKIRFNFSNFDAVPQARRAHAQVMDGTIRDCSVGFSNTQRREPTDEERLKHPGIKEVIEKATLDEVSLVLRGAVPGAKVLAVRSVRMAGSSVDEDFVISLARQVAEGSLTPEAAKAAIQLASEPMQTGLSQSETVEGEGESEASGEPSPEAALDNAMLDADIDATLQAFA